MDKSNQGMRTPRRRHSAVFKAEVITACLQPGVSMAAIAMHYGLNANMVRTWVSAHEGLLVSEHAGVAPNIATAEFIPLQLSSAHAPVAIPDIVIEVRHGTSTVTIRWPQAAAADCAGWLTGWLR